MADPARELSRELGITSGRPQRRSFVFADWCQEEAFEYPTRAAQFVERAGSPAEAYFLRGLAELPGVTFDGAAAIYKGITIRSQVSEDRFKLDAVLERQWVRLCVEIDGQHHHETPKQIGDDYFRQRRLQYRGYVVVRFTASEAMNNARGCWRSAFEILDVQLRLPMHRPNH